MVIKARFYSFDGMKEKKNIQDVLYLLKAIVSCSVPLYNN